MDGHSRLQRSHSQRSSRSIRPIEVHPNLDTSETGHAGAQEHAPSPTSASSGRPSFQIHGRTSSTLSSATDSSNARGTRFSLQVPIQPVTEMSPVSSGSPVDEALPQSATYPTGPVDTNFLTAIAAQERRVLELKEELLRAEGDLMKLKKQWATHEAQKKRDEARRVTRLQPLNTNVPSPVLASGSESMEDEDGGNAWLQQEMERRKALLSAGRHSGRTVFSGSRHTRALSLLSPTASNYPPSSAPRPPRQDSLVGRTSQEASGHTMRPQPLSRASTTPDLLAAVAERAESADIASPNPIDREMILNTGKKMATGFRDGLWTFIEDLRQATVGDDAVQTVYPGARPPNGPRRQSSSQTLRAARRQSSRTSLRSTSTAGSTETRKALSKSPSGRRQATLETPHDYGVPEEEPLVDVGGSFWQENGVAAVTPKNNVGTKHSKAISKASNTSSGEDNAWDVWPDSSPAPSVSDSRSSSAASNAVSTPRTSASSTYNDLISEADGLPDRSKSDSKRDSIPWPAISKLGPAQLRRTASHLMSEWEKSLTPSPGQEWQGPDSEDYMGCAAEAGAAAVANGREGSKAD